MTAEDGPRSEDGPRLVDRLGPAVGDYPPGAVFGPRTAANFEFVWIIHGRARWTCGEMTQDLRPGTLLLVRPGMRDHFAWDPGGFTRHGYVHFALCAEPGQERWPLVRDLGGREDPMAALCRYLLWLGTERPDGWRHRAAGVLRLLLPVFTKGPLPAPGEPRDTVPTPLAAMAAYVRERWSGGTAEPLTLAELASAAGVSESTLCRLFRRHFGTGPVAAVELLRLARAEPLLWLSNLSLRAVAQQCGFADAYHLSRRFKAVYGVTPSAFRAAGPERAPSSPAAPGLRALIWRE